MNQNNDGGTAFPVIKTLGPGGKAGRLEDGYGSIVSEGGMSLRDWFAGQSLAELVHGADSNGYWNPDNEDVWPRAALVAMAAYQIADAMLAERERRTE
jgi:hypothetical protein